MIESIKRGADINTKNKYGISVFHYAFMNNFFDIVKILFENGYILENNYTFEHFTKSLIIKLYDNEDLAYNIFLYFIKQYKYISLNDIDEILNNKNNKNIKINNFLIEYKKNIKNYIDKYINTLNI